MTDTTDILILGATGATGRATAESLAANGVAYRALSRDPARVRTPLAAPVAGDLDDFAGVDEALEGVRAAYVVTPSSERAEEQQLRFLDRAAEAGVSHVVLLSQLGASADSPVRFLRYHAAVDAHALSLGLGVTALRPNLFMQGLLAFAEVVRGTSTLPAPIGEAPVSLIDVRDIGAVAAHALTAREPLGVQTLTGPEGLTHAQLADELGRATGRPIRFAQVAPDQFAEMLAGVLPPWQAAGMLEDYAHYDRGEAADVSPAVRRILGREARGFRAFAEEHAAAFAPAR